MADNLGIDNSDTEDADEPVIETWVGTHGTCQTFGEAIKSKNSFRTPLKPGMCGTGVYFWIGELRVTLAREWYLSRQQDFKYQPKSGCCIVESEIQCDENNVLHMAEPIFVSTIEKIVLSAKAKGRHLNHEKMAELHDLAVEMLENELGVDFHVVFRAVPPPDPHNTDYPRELGWPLCLMVRHSDCIKSIDLLGA